VERAGRSRRPLPGAQAHHQRAAGAAHHLRRHGGCAGPLGLPLPPAVPHGGGHVPRGGGGMSTKRRDTSIISRRSALLAALLLAMPLTATAQSAPAPAGSTAPVAM